MCRRWGTSNTFTCRVFVSTSQAKASTVLSAALGKLPDAELQVAPGLPQIASASRIEGPVTSAPPGVGVDRGLGQPRPAARGEHPIGRLDWVAESVWPA
jgi:hypothetical protein